MKQNKVFFQLSNTKNSELFTEREYSGSLILFSSLYYFNYFFQIWFKEVSALLIVTLKQN